MLHYGERFLKTNPWYLAPFSWVYQAIVLVRNWLYDRQFIESVRVKPIVVSIGNVVAGGSGKTPFTHLLAKSFPHRTVEIITRMEDEAMLLRKRLPNIKVTASRHRAKVASESDADLIILDDGFQHRKLHRDFDIVLGKRSGHFLPRGFLRDDPKRKADAFFDIKLKVTGIFSAAGTRIDSIAGFPVTLFCGIAHPERFRKTVEDLGAVIERAVYFSDHTVKVPKGKFLLCTEKDIVKIPESNSHYLEMEAIPPEGFEELLAKIDSAIDNKRHENYPSQAR